MMPPATGDADDPKADGGGGGQGWSIYPTASRHNCSRLQVEPSPLQSEYVHMATLMQKGHKYFAASLPSTIGKLKDWLWKPIPMFRKYE
jgi:hypothetical protein